jgi:hypothetical protein
MKISAIGGSYIIIYIDWIIPFMSLDIKIQKYFCSGVKLMHSFLAIFQVFSAHKNGEFVECCLSGSGIDGEFEHYDLLGLLGLGNRHKLPKQRQLLHNPSCCCHHPRPGPTSAPAKSDTFSIAFFSTPKSDTFY